MKVRAPSARINGIGHDAYGIMPYLEKCNRMINDLVGTHSRDYFGIKPQKPQIVSVIELFENSSEIQIRVIK